MITLADVRRGPAREQEGATVPFLTQLQSTEGARPETDFNMDSET